MKESDDLCFTAPPGPKPMLTISENVVSFKVFESKSGDTILQQLTTNTGERHWSVVGQILACTLLENSCNIYMSPVFRYDALAEGLVEDDCQDWGQFNGTLLCNTF